MLKSGAFTQREADVLIAVDRVLGPSASRAQIRFELTDSAGAERWSDDLWLERAGSTWKVALPSEELTLATSAEPDVPIQKTPYEGEPQNPSRLVSPEQLRRLGLSSLSSDTSEQSQGGEGSNASLAAATKYCFKQFVQMVGEGIGEDYFSSDGFYFTSFNSPNLVSSHQSSSRIRAGSTPQCSR